jgi:uncharacterized membrane protein YphA (DoxX/SURF4 family)
MTCDWRVMVSMEIVTILQICCQLIIGLSILCVWFLRSNKKTSYRGGASSSLKDEFTAYGLPVWMFWIVGILKVGAALALLVGIVVPVLVNPAAMLMAGLMASAIIMHLKVKDSPNKFLPATIVLTLSVILIFT